MCKQNKKLCEMNEGTIVTKLIHIFSSDAKSVRQIWMVNCFILALFPIFHLRYYGW